MKPFRRPVLHPNFGCIAILATGERCSRMHWTEYPITFAWDPIKGVGIDAPSATLCRMHGYLWELADGERVEIVGGWMGQAWNPDAKVWTVLTTVYESKDSLFASKHWWALRRPSVFGQCDRVRYDEAIAAMAAAS
jgi:hypothetical protein